MLDFFFVRLFRLLFFMMNLEARKKIINERIAHLHVYAFDKLNEIITVEYHKHDFSQGRSGKL